MAVHKGRSRGTSHRGRSFLLLLRGCGGCRFSVTGSTPGSHAAFGSEPRRRHGAQGPRRPGCAHAAAAVAGRRCRMHGGPSAGGRGVGHDWAAWTSRVAALGRLDRPDDREGAQRRAAHAPHWADRLAEQRRTERYGTRIVYWLSGGGRAACAAVPAACAAGDGVDARAAAGAAGGHGERAAGQPSQVADRRYRAGQPRYRRAAHSGCDARQCQHAAAEEVRLHGDEADPSGRYGRAGRARPHRAPGTAGIHGPAGLHRAPGPPGDRRDAGSRRTAGQRCSRPPHTPAPALARVPRSSNH